MNDRQTPAPRRRTAEEAWSMVTPGDVVRTIRRRLPSVIFTTLIVTAAVVALLIVWPNQYVSEGLMYVRLGRSATGNDPTTKNSPPVSMQESRTAEVVSIGEMISSHEIAERAVDRVGVQEINRPHNWLQRSLKDFGETLQSNQTFAAFLPKNEPGAIGDYSPQQVVAQLEREKAIKTVQDSTDVEIAKNGYTVAIAGKGSDPLLVQSIVQAIMDQYGRYHVEAHQAEGSQDFFEKQARDSRELARNTRRELQDTRNQMGWLSIDSAEETLRERMIDLERSLNLADSELAEAVSQAEELKRQLTATEPWIPTETTTGIANAAGDEMRGQLYGVEVADGEELSKLSANHPRYRRLKAKMDAGRQIVDTENTERELRMEAINPVYQALETQFQSVRAKAVGLKSRRQAIEDRLAQTQKDMARFNDDTTLLSQLQWEAELAEQTYRDHARSLEEARVNTALDAEQMSDVSVIQPASLNLKKAGPPRGLLSVVGLMLGLSLGMLQAILRDSPAAAAVAGDEDQSGDQTAQPAQPARPAEPAPAAALTKSRPVEPVSTLATSHPR